VTDLEEQKRMLLNSFEEFLEDVLDEFAKI